MLTGADIRRYRQLLRLNQLEFSKQLGVSQPTLSMLEAGRIALTDEHHAALKKRFIQTAKGPAFAEFVKSIESERKSHQAALVESRGRHLTVAVWRWRDGWDMSQPPSQSDVIDLVIVPFFSTPVIAFAMPRATGHWLNGEILVFAGCAPSEVLDRDICLVQCTRRRSRSPATAIAVAQHVNSGNGRVLQLETISPPCTTLIAEQEQIQALLRVVYRARHV